MRNYRTIQQSLYSSPDSNLEMDKTGDLYRNTLKSYHYEQMLNRLNEVDKGIHDSVGYFLRRLWEKYEKEGKLIVHSTNVEGGRHEQKMKELNIKERNIRFENGGIYTDLVFDTYQKDWTKAYQLTFHEFFHVIDRIAYEEGISSSKSHRRSNFQFDNPEGKDPYVFDASKKYQFGEIIIKDVQNLKDTRELQVIHSLPKHDKAPIYDAIGGVFYKDKYPDERLDDGLFTKRNADERYYEQYGHDPVSWLKDGFKNENITLYIPKEESLDYFDKLMPIAIKYNYINTNGVKDYRKFIEDNFPAGKRTDAELSTNENKALSVLAMVAANAIKAPDTDAEAARANAVTAEILGKVQKYFPARLAMEVFANIAVTAIANPKAYEAIQKYLPNSYKMFMKILDAMFHRVL